MKRIQRKRTRGWKMPSNTIYVGRPTKWGNPFKVGSYLNAWGKAFIATQLCKTAKEVKELYKSGILDKKITLENSLKWYEMSIKFKIKHKVLDINELKEKDLACWCSLDKLCHADILIKLCKSIK